MILERLEVKMLRSLKEILGYEILSLDGRAGRVDDFIFDIDSWRVRYVIADQIPLLFDYGIALNRRQNEGIGNLQFHLGYTF